MFSDYRPYVPVATRRQRAEREMAKRRKNGHVVSPVVIEGRTIARTFWGKAWCDNLEGYSDFANRLPRGRTYVRNGSVVDLQIVRGAVKAIVSGSEMYTVAVKVSPVPKERWSCICTDAAGAIDSLVELLQGRFSKGVMARICQQRTGLFPSPEEITLSCSCPDWATMCKHVAAVLYGIGARLDERPELLFNLRAVDEKELIAKAGTGLPLSHKAPENVLEGSDLSELFGLELAEGAPPAAKASGKRAAATRGKTAPGAKNKPTAARANKPGPRKHASEPPRRSTQPGKRRASRKGGRTRGQR